ncbi:hypothetical protein KXD93_11515 [Mucilaginibacter sp. BJC16-A38]|uniref:hypothetical protein n=1 Tax=Mucilaginibacter phenanthrenivorans TaxID=1234842 RepID=UPI0021578C0E|nr:hypothetical protein [Mucilaginibacter phenanthrenivorans]MCR8558278.1 hypothetical protein [Mucilaginibacter phenanthrenivorans]
MKKHLFFFAVIFFTSSCFAFAQNKIDKYCQVIIGPKNGLTTKRIAKISFGDNKDLFALKDTTVFQKLHFNVDHMVTETDVLNYMSKSGWTLVDIHSAFQYNHYEVIYFKKAFDISELAETPSN